MQSLASGQLCVPSEGLNNRAVAGKSHEGQRSKPLFSPMLLKYLTLQSVGARGTR